MPVRMRAGPYSFGDFLELIQEDQKADLINGVIFMASPESFDHNKLVGFLYHALDMYVQHHQLGEVVVNRVAFQLGDRSGPEPDVAFVARDRVSRVKSGYVDGPPDFAIEVVSPSSVDQDYEVKRSLYESAGVREYWIIDAEEKTAVLFQLRDGRFVEVFPENRRIGSAVVPGFEIEVDWLWQRPLPPTLPILQAMIARTP